MQIIQNIREKGAAIVITVIALSLIGFILMDAQQGGSRLFGSGSNKIGNVNGNSFDLNQYNVKIKEAEDMEEQRTGQRPSGSRSYQIREQVWNQMVAEQIFNEEASKLGMDLFTGKELQAILLSNDQNNPFLQEKSLMDPATGKIDIAKAQEALANIKKAKGTQREAIENQIVKPVTLSAKVARYSAMMNSSAYYPSWLEKKDQENTKNFSVFNYVYIPFTEISDSAVKVSDEDVQEYVNTHKDLFKQEAGRGLSYYSFSLAPSNEDSLAAKMQLEQLVSSFAADTNNTSFVAKNGSTIEFPNKCVPKAQSGSTMIDSIISRPLGSVYGPYFEASKSSYVIAKYIAVKSVPDSVKARHILIVTGDMNTGKQIRTDEEAKKQADSLLAAINAGSDFGSLAAQFSADGSKDKGGDLGTFGFGAMVPEFNDFCFYKSAGERGVVKTQFGYHVIEVQSQSNFNSAYNIAYINKEVFASEATVGQANLAATKASAIKDQKALTAYAAKNGLKIVTVPTTVKENDYLVGGLDDARQLVKWAFEAKKGDVSDPLNIGDQVIVAIVDKEFKEGTKDVATARPGCETIIRNKKKAEMIIKKTGEKPTLEAAAAAYNKQIMEAGADSSINFSAQIINNVGMEPKMIGAVLNKSLIGKTSPAFYGNSGVFVVKVNSIQSRPADSPEMARLQAEQKLSGLRGQTNGWYEGLKKLADIEDNRSNFY